MTQIITPKHSFYDIDLKGIWRYRDLYFMFIRRDIVTQYKQTILGPLWYIIQPLFTTVMYIFVFGGLAGIPTDGAPQLLFYLAGVLLWNYFSETILLCSNTFSANASVFGKVYFPRLIVPLSGATSNLLKMFINLIIFLLFYLYFKLFTPYGETLTLNYSLFLFPVLILMLAVHALSWGLIISSFTTKYRDLRFMIQFGIQLFMYATPVIYPLSAAPEQYQMIIRFNPLTPIFEAFKYSTLSCGALDWSGLSYSIIVMLISVLLSLFFFSRTERNFMDNI